MSHRPRPWNCDNNIYTPLLLYPENMLSKIYYFRLQDGCVQIRVRALPQEAERCHEISAQDQVLAVPPTHQGKYDLGTFDPCLTLNFLGPPCSQAYQTRQGPPSWIQGQAGIRHLQDRHEAWREEAPRRQGLSLW